MNSNEYNQTLAGMANDFRLHTVAMPCLPSKPNEFRSYAARFSELEIWDELDFVYLPCGDGLAQCLGAKSRLPGQSRLRSLLQRCEALIFGGRFGYTNGWLRRIRSWISAYSLNASAWGSLFHLDPYQYEFLSRNSAWKLMPDPVSHFDNISATEARKQLQLPANGLCFGMTGWIEKSKGADMMLEAFAMASDQLPKDSFLLLAGPVCDGLGIEAAQRYSSLIENRRIIILDQLFPEKSMRMLLQAMDFVCLPYRRSTQSASIFVKAVAHRRPVIATNSGWMERTTKLLENGWLCQLGDVSSLADKMIEAATSSKDCWDLSSGKINRFLEYHATENFQATWTTCIRKVMGVPNSNALRSWNWVLDARQDGRL
ncbi:MAG: glycosyltransferase [Pirellula sp.]